jgi:hypothetical protein
MKEIDSSSDAIPSPFAETLLVDTCHGSLLHLLFRAPLPNAVLNWPSRILPFLFALLLFGLVPTALAMFTQAQWWNPAEGLEFPVLRDYATICLGFVTLPLCVTFLWTERHLIPQKLQSISQSGVLRLRDPVNTEFWQRRFKVTNLLAQFVGLIIGLACSFAIYSQWSQHPATIGTWQVNAQRDIVAAGWIFLAWQIPMFWTVITLYVFRAACIQALLRSLVSVSEVTPQPFHPDRAGGMSEVANIGLRNQYLLAAVGIQLVCAFVIAQSLRHLIPEMGSFLISTTIACASAYLVAGPFVFVAPLLPFRRSMLEKKSAALRKLGDGLQRVVDTIVRKLPHETPSEVQEKDIARYQLLMGMVEQEPVWPFDLVTRKRFMSAYLLPFLAWVVALPPVSEAIATAVHWLSGVP